MSFRNNAERDAFADDVLGYLGASYMAEDGTLFQGQSLSYVKACLRDGFGGRKWKLAGGDWGFVEALEEAGFKVTQGRTMRITRNGQCKPYAACSVVTL